ncbi:hypothetical protein EV426DRAFT_707066 [Tirmania nivea]|nr:hypothetical protein EV426DRAFT_707066 [Tirmania nivea]
MKTIRSVKSEILDLLDNPTPEKYAKLESKKRMDEDSYKILLDARIIHCLNMVLNSKRLMVYPIPKNIILLSTLMKTYTILLEEHNKEENNNDEEKEDKEEEKED